ncbi:MAG: hypothetical protein LBT32_04855 [Peptococcaceae bacterium]|jgi:hypothetical protein|nr:hypothetical protein [Peptococcaceae bacterium]
MRFKSKFTRILAIWVVFSLCLQFGVYALVNQRITRGIAAPPPITKILEADIPDVDLENIQISYAKDYLTYQTHGVFKVYNLTQQKVVFTKSAPAGSDQNMGVIDYYWLPDRNTLIYFYAKKNPNPYSMVLVQPAKTITAPVSEDAPEAQGTIPTPTPAEPTYERRENNPQITELNTLQFPESDDADAEPEDRYNIDVDAFPAGGKIQHIVASTFTNLVYLLIKTSGGALQLMEIDVMKDTRWLHQSGESINNIAASDLYGTLYIESKSGNAKQIFALSGNQRQKVVADNNKTILGDRDGKLYLGTVEDKRLTAIEVGLDKTDIKQSIGLTSFWQGSIPFEDRRVLIGVSGEVIIYDDEQAHVITETGDQEIMLNGNGQRAVISSDGVELLQLSEQDGYTRIKLKPFAAYN